MMENIQLKLEKIIVEKRAAFTDKSKSQMGLLSLTAEIERYQTLLTALKKDLSLEQFTTDIDRAFNLNRNAGYHVQGERIALENVIEMLRAKLHE